MTNEPFFIVGCPRSGTTLLRVLLDSHRKLVVAPESSFLFRMEKILFLYGDLNKEKNLNGLIEDLLAIKRVADWFPKKWSSEQVAERVKKTGIVTFKIVVETLYEIYAESQKKVRWGDKTPENLLSVDRIKKMFPPAKIIIVVRDGRDVALSLKHADFGAMNMVYAGTMWSHYSAVAKKLREHYKKDIYTIKYEDLIQNPEKKVREILTFLGEEYEEDIFKNYLKHTDDVQHTRSRYYKKAIETGNSAKWKTEMTDDEKRDFEAVAGRALQEEGYEVHGRKPISFLRRYAFLLLENGKRLTNKVYTINLKNFLKIVMNRIVKRLFLVWSSWSPSF